jgi:hypothetical protein
MEAKDRNAASGQLGDDGIRVLIVVVGNDQHCVSHRSPFEKFTQKDGERDFRSRSPSSAACAALCGGSGQVS